MSWVVPNGCYYYGFLSSMRTGQIHDQWSYSSGATVPDSRQPGFISGTAEVSFILVDFNNNLIYSTLYSRPYDPLKLGGTSKTRYWFNIDNVNHEVSCNVKDTYAFSTERHSDKTIVYIIGSNNSGIFKRTFLFSGTQYTCLVAKTNSFPLGDVNNKTILPKDAFPSGITYYARHTFRGNSSLTSPPRIPGGVTNMSYCFDGCTSLTSPPVIPNGVTNMSYCFSSCTSLTTPPVIPTSVVDLSSCFGGCTSLTSPPLIPSNVTDMDYCFQGCTSLTTPPVIPTSVTSLINCFSSCTSLTTPPVIPNGVTSLGRTFLNCTSLTTPPVIPNSVTNMTNCFRGCTSLTTPPSIPTSVDILPNCFKDCVSLSGNILVNNQTLSSYEGIFDNTINSIFIVNNTGSIADVWEHNIAPQYTNVHYEANDNQPPSVSLTVTRVDTAQSENPSPNGLYAFIKATVTVFDNLLPNGWTNTTLESDVILTKDSVTETSTWTKTNVGNVYTLKTHIYLDDTARHIFTFQTSDQILNASDVLKASHISSVVEQTLSKSYKLVDYFHETDPNSPAYGTEGVAFGKFATDANLFDVDMPALFRDVTECKDMTSQEISDFLDSMAVPYAVDYIVEEGTSGIWTYRKWASGIAECWGTKASQNYAMTQAYGSVYYGSSYVDLPSGLFIAAPVVNGSRCGGTDGSGLVSISNYTVTNSRISYFIWNPASYTINLSIAFMVKGRWK